MMRALQFSRTNAARTVLKYPREIRFAGFSSAAKEKEEDAGTGSLQRQLSNNKMNERLAHFLTGRTDVISARDRGTSSGVWRRQNVDLNFSFGDWREHESTFRHFKHLTPRSLIQSSTFRRLLFPDLFVVGLTSSFITWWNMGILEKQAGKDIDTYVAGHLIELHDFMITLPTVPFTLSAFALGLLVTFRTQSGNARYVQARKDWGAIINVTRDLSSRIVNRFPCEKRRAYGVKLVQSFPYTLMYHLTEDGGGASKMVIDNNMTAEDCEAAKAKVLRELLEKDIWANPTDDDRAYLDKLFSSDVANRPLHVLNEIRRINVLSSNEEGEKSLASVGNPIISTGIDGRILDLMNSLGSCERILRTPIYTSYTRHASRFLTLWCNALPMALYPVVGPEMTVPFSLAISFIMFGIEDIGTRVEQPFNILPLWQYSDVIKKSCEQVSAHGSPFQ